MKTTDTIKAALATNAPINSVRQACKLVGVKAKGSRAAMQAAIYAAAVNDAEWVYATDQAPVVVVVSDVPTVAVLECVDNEIADAAAEIATNATQDSNLVSCPEGGEPRWRQIARWVKGQRLGFGTVEKPTVTAAELEEYHRPSDWADMTAGRKAAWTRKHRAAANPEKYAANADARKAAARKAVATRKLRTIALEGHVALNKARRAAASVGSFCVRASAAS